LELNIFGVNEDRKTDVLDYAYLLDGAPSLEILELHVNSSFQTLETIQFLLM
jgi:Tfp pilus assembly ATPase PilU